MRTSAPPTAATCPRRTPAGCVSATAAPDFSLLAYSGDVLTLSDFRGQKNVVLAFYRGHW